MPRKKSSPAESPILADGNEKECGEGLKKAIADGIVKREEVYVVSKLWVSSFLTVEEERGVKADLDVSRPLPLTFTASEHLPRQGKIKLPHLK